MLLNILQGSLPYQVQNVNSAEAKKPWLGGIGGERTKSREEVGGQSALTSVSQAQGSAGRCGVNKMSSGCPAVGKLISCCQDPLYQVRVPGRNAG